MSDSNSTEQINSEDLPVYNKATLPATGQLILLVDEPDYDNGGTLNAAYRLPLNRLTPGSSFQSNTYSLNSVAAGISIPDQTVVPGYVEGFDPYTLKRAQASSNTTKAQFVIVGLDQNIDDSYIIQGSGFFSFPTVHNYEVGKTYYLSDSAPGGVVTTPPVGIVQRLFTVVDQKTILIQIGQ